MKIFAAPQIRSWDAYTIEHEPISSVDLMERAATACFEWINDNLAAVEKFTVFCSTGNNGGDGLVISRLLAAVGKEVIVYVLQSNKQTTDFTINLERLQQFPVEIIQIGAAPFPAVANDTIVIDALFGTGLNRPLEDNAAMLVAHINRQNATVISIDIPSGLLTDAATDSPVIMKADHTLTFQVYKLACMMQVSKTYTGKVHLLDIGLHPDFYNNTFTPYNTTTEQVAAGTFQPRGQGTHKYSFGHALLYAGSKNMMGAAILCAKACLRSGAGLVTVHTEEGTQPVMQAALPEAISNVENNTELLWHKKAAIGIGPGIISDTTNQALLDQLIVTWQHALVIDATGLGLLINSKQLLTKRQLHPAVLTPHTGEFDKLFGASENDFERMEKALQYAHTLNCYIVLKGPNTLIACPDGDAFFNTTGNAGMATAGSGDTLTGILTGLLAQGYGEKDACILGVYLHGLAGDIAAGKRSQEAMIASDITECIGDAFISIAAIKKAGQIRPQ